LHAETVEKNNMYKHEKCLKISWRVDEKIAEDCRK
jgi:hypothetical protein